MSQSALKSKRIVLIHWKQQDRVEVFSNLKLFCISYPEFNYNTLNNYLSKDKTAYDSDIIRVERKEIISKPTLKNTAIVVSRNIAPVARRVEMKKADDSLRDLKYWLSQSPNKRAEAITFLVSQMLEKDQRMDKTIINKIRPAR